MIAETVKWIGGVDGFLELIDQRRLPAEFVKLQCRDTEQLYEAIKTLAVRGAPALGVAGAYGLVLVTQKLDAKCSMQEAFERLKEAADYLGSSRPTAVNLSWALNRIKSKAENFIAQNAKADLRQLQELVLEEANAICREDVDMCRRIGENGQRFIKDGDGILTHCNAGALATAGQGTALSVMFEAQKKGKKFKVYVDETRPLLQGARLTAWELRQAGIDTVVICDSMAGWLMKQGKINAVLTGADRIAANGDAANKIGTYSLSVLAREHGIPFYLAAPSSTFDLRIKNGGQIPIEQRSADEVRFLYHGLPAHESTAKMAVPQITPDGVEIYNPAFDITQAKDITAIITDRGVIEKPTQKKIAEHFKRKGK